MLHKHEITIDYWQQWLNTIEFEAFLGKALANMVEVCLIVNLVIDTKIKDIFSKNDWSYLY